LKNSCPSSRARSVAKQATAAGSIIVRQKKRGLHNRRRASATCDEARSSSLLQARVLGTRRRQRGAVPRQRRRRGRTCAARLTAGGVRTRAVALEEGRCRRRQVAEPRRPPRNCTYCGSLSSCVRTRLATPSDIAGLTRDLLAAYSTCEERCGRRGLSHRRSCCCFWTWKTVVEKPSAAAASSCSSAQGPGGGSKYMPERTMGVQLINMPRF
jgi:hypothetical protein